MVEYRTFLREVSWKYNNYILFCLAPQYFGIYGPKTVGQIYYYHSSGYYLDSLQKRTGTNIRDYITLCVK